MTVAGQPPWRVAAIMNEPLGEVLRFCAWYFMLGAQEVVICFDNPDDPAIELLSPHPRIRCVPCTQAFWADLGMSRELAFVTRQNAAMTWVYQQYSDGWLLNVDADEFLFLKGREVSALLSEVAPHVVSVRVATAEHIQPEAETDDLCFRLPMDYQVRRDIYGADAELFGPRRQGLVGHPQGKSLIRCGVKGVTLRQHWPNVPAKDQPTQLLLESDSDVYLLHMIGESFEIWRSKLNWRLGSRGFTAGLKACVNEILSGADVDAELKQLHRRLHFANAARLEHMEACGVLLRCCIDFDALAMHYFNVDPKDLPTKTTL